MHPRHTLSALLLPLLLLTGCALPPMPERPQSAALDAQHYLAALDDAALTIAQEV